MLDHLQRVWTRSRISIQTKQRIRSAFFFALPFLFRGHPAYPAWLEHRRSKGARFVPALSDGIESVALTEQPPPSDPPVKLLAFYLPQFHPIPENDEWWGMGFTEWRNVIRGQPRFVGHYQPHLPGELGFYDLRVPEVQARQVELARLYGIAGFVFYFYWFGGRRLLERPLLQYLEDPRLDLPFCLCWANESWSRRWDGRERDVLIAQSHSPSDDIAFISYVARYLRDPRYIRIAGRPLLIVYRPDLFPNKKETTDRWRSWCRDQGIGELFLAFTQSFETADPARYGLDAAIEFPPNNSGAPDISKDVELVDSDFSGVVYDWRIFPRRSRSYSDPKYHLFRGVNSGWDNDARRPSRGAIFYGSSPSGYRQWLENAIEDTLHRFQEPDERLVFINAWNEWAEGAHLEPDQRYGYAYLQATRDALVTARMRWRRSILVVTHDARLHGAQLLALHIAQELYQALGYRVHVLSLGPGPLMDAYSKCADARMIDVENDGYRAVRSYANHLKSLGITIALVNSTASAGSLPALKAAGMHVVTLIHELPDLMRRHRLEEYARVAANQADILVFPANQVEQGFANYGPLVTERVRIRPQGLYKRNRFAPSTRPHARTELRRRLRLSPDAVIILGVGFGDHRKGFDLFVDIGIQVALANAHTVSVWIGLLEPTLESKALLKIDECGLLEHFVFPGHESETDLFYFGSDLYAMTSREDPFPSVVLEALDAGLPVVGFRGAGGFSELEATGCMRLACASDVTAFAQAVSELLRDEPERQAIAEKARALVAREYSFRRYVFDLLSFTPAAPPRISVVVPNYNYLRYLPERMRTIQEQTVPVYEIIVLDDCSSDGSQEWLTHELPKLLPDAQVVLNEANSGSVFEQWRKGVSLARGDYVWIAEADDLAKPDFLAEVVGAFEDRRVVLSYCESEQIDELGEILARDYLDYVADVSESKWRNSYVAEGVEEIRTGLAVKNTIPNVSAVVFRRDVLADTLEANILHIKRYRNAGDWVVYVQALRRGNIAFCSIPLNRHRRHGRGVTIKAFGRDQLEEILTVQAQIRTAFSPDSATVARATGYAERLYHQFRLGTAAKPTIHEDPSLAPMLEVDTRDRG